MKQIIKHKFKGNRFSQGHTPLPEMAVLTVEQLLQCLNEAGLKKVSDLLKSECKPNKVIKYL